MRVVLRPRRGRAVSADGKRKLAYTWDYNVMSVGMKFTAVYGYDSWDEVKHKLTNRARVFVMEYESRDVTTPEAYNDCVIVKGPITEPDEEVERQGQTSLRYGIGWTIYAWDIGQKFHYMFCTKTFDAALSQKADEASMHVVAFDAPFEFDNVDARPRLVRDATVVTGPFKTRWELRDMCREGLLSETVASQLLDEALPSPHPCEAEPELDERRATPPQREEVDWDRYNGFVGREVEGQSRVETMTDDVWRRYNGGA